VKRIIALPAYNEEEALPRLFASIARDLAGLEHEVLVVDDGSKDRTAEVIRKHAETQPVVLVSHPKNMGLAAAMRTCLTQAAARAEARDWIITMDADDTHPPRQIREMPLEAEFDLCQVSRYAPGAKIAGVPAMRMKTSDTASAFLRTLWPVPGVTDYSCGYRAYRGDLLKRLIERHGERLIQSTGFAVQVELILKIRRLGLKGCEIPIDLQYDRKPTPSKARMWHTVIDLARVLARDTLESLR
jgi:dolichol-phosphate mannosyltransferase